MGIVSVKVVTHARDRNHRAHLKNETGSFVMDVDIVMELLGVPVSGHLVTYYAVSS